MISRWLKISVTLLVLTYVGYRLFSEGENVFRNIWHLSAVQGFILFLAFILMPLNWGLETIKWKISLQRVYSDISFWDAWSGVWAGLATGIFTPNRLGEYAGRIAFIPQTYRLEAAIYLFADRFCQLIITVWAGWLGLEWIAIYHADYLSQWVPGIQWLWLWIFWGCRTIALLLLLIVLFPPKRLPVNILGDRFRPWLLKAQSALEKLDTQLLWTLLGISLIRYIVFSFQYFMLLFAFGNEHTKLMTFALINLIFLIKSLVPGIALTELGIRESIALYVMGAVGISAFSAFSSTFLLYMINLLIPSLIGLIFVYRIRQI